jgi:hypothetical protein
MAWSDIEEFPRNPNRSLRNAAVSFEAHRGRLRLEHRARGGATVTVCLPGREAGSAGQSSRARLTMTRS